ncbi:MAG: delta-60 repeat domain-containing protein [Actinomycetota bacterium]
MKASPGELDVSFSGDGKVTTQFASESADEAHAVAVQPDGKIVAAGESTGDFALARYTTAGTLDPSFGDGGRVQTVFDLGSDDVVSALAIQADGKIVAVGVSNNRFALARYDTDGALDTTFNGDGKVITQFTSGSADLAFAVAVQADGKIVAAGVSNDKFALARYKTNGALDTAFNGDGKVITHFTAGSADQAQSVAIQADGKIVAAGESFPSSSATADFALARYTPGGGLDTTFSGDGKLTTCFAAGSDDSADAVAVQADGRIVAAGFSGQRFGLSRYTPAGRLDATWGGDGKVTTRFSDRSTDSADAVAIQENGKIVAAGDSSLTNDHFALARYRTDGGLDSTFGGDGTVTTHFTTRSDDVAFAMAIQADGNVVAAGRCELSYYYSRFALARYVAS